MKYFTIPELTKSATASRRKIDNTPSAAVIANLTALVDNILDPLREAWGAPIVVTSGYRCVRLNAAVGGVKTSQHTLGQAADIRTVSDKPADNKRLFDLIVKLGLPYDQLIDEYGYNWVHVSYSSRNRRQILHIK
ncbi:MAG: peptidase M15 [Paludibacteraceae bacterium]|nr:peptidase M15 [Paludibacteraceae bacterium]